jgi:hypothetical protein
MPAEPALFPEITAALEAPRYGPGWYGKRKRGRGATPRIERVWIAPLPNPVGLYKLEFRFRPLQRHSGRCVNPRTLEPLLPPRTVWEAACNLIAYYFQHVGGFRVADDAVVTAWADTLTRYTPREIQWAIDAKAETLAADTEEERREKRKYVPDPRTAPGKFDQWLQKAPEYWADDDPRVQAALAARRERRLKAIAARREDYERLLRARDDERHQQERERFQRAAEESEEAEQRFWQSLTDQQRADAIRAVRAECNKLAAAWGWPPDSPAHQRLLEQMALDWARKKWTLKDPEGNRQGRAGVSPASRAIPTGGRDARPTHSPPKDAKRGR